MIKSYWLRILLCGVTAAVLGYVIGLVTPKQYDAVVQVLLAPYSPVMGTSPDPADNSVQDIINASAPRSIATQVEMLTSIGVIQTASEKVGADTGKPYQDPGDELNWSELQDKIMITAAKESDIVTLRVRMSKPELAQQVAQQIYLAFEDMNERQSQSAADNAIRFLSSQYNSFQNQLEAIESASAKAREQSGVADVAIQAQAIVSEIRELDTAAETAKGDLVGAQARYDELKAKINDVPKEMSGGSSVSENPQYTRLTSNLADAVATRAAHLQRYLEDSEVVQQDDLLIKNLRSQLQSTKRYVPNLESSKQPNPTHTQLEQELTLSQAAIDGAKQKLASIVASTSAKKAELNQLPGIQQKLDNLDRQRVVFERISQIYQSKLKTLEMAKRARTARTSPVTTAVAIPRPAIPNMQLNVGLGLFLGLAVGFLWSIGTEAKRNPIRSLGQLNRLSLLPCYRVIPELRVPMRGLGRPPADVFDALLANFVRSEKKGYRLGVLGVTRSAGATTTSMNLAIAAARGGYSVLFVEVDPGNNVASKLAPSAGDAKSAGANISFYNASLGEAGVTGQSAEFESAAQGKDLVIFDFPPVKASGDAFLHANQLDEMVLLVRQNMTKSVDFLQAQQALIDTGCPSVTVVLARVHDQSDDVSALEQQAESRSITPQA